MKVVIPLVVDYDTDEWAEEYGLSTDEAPVDLVNQIRRQAVEQGGLVEVVSERWPQMRGHLSVEPLLTDRGPVYRYLDLSTAHLPPALLANLNSYTGVVADRTRYGWLLWVPEDPDAHAADYADTDPSDDEDYGVPREVLAIQRHARSLGCERVLLDADGPKLAELPTFETL